MEQRKRKSRRVRVGMLQELKVVTEKVRCQQSPEGVK